MALLSRNTTAGSSASAAPGQLQQVGQALETLANLVSGNKLQAALDTVTYGYKAGLKGSREDVDYTNAKIPSGNYAGLSNSELQKIASDIAKQGATQALASEALVKLMQSGKVSGSVMPVAATAVVEMNRLGKVPIEDATELFSKIRDEPTKFSRDLNREHRFLGPAEYERIGKLEASGQKEAAGDLAQKLFAEARIREARTAAANRGLFDRLTQSGTDFLASVDDGVRDWGRRKTPQQRLDEASRLQKRFDERETEEGRRFAVTGGDAAVGFPNRSSAGKRAREEVERRAEIVRLEAQSNAAQSERTRQANSAIDAIQEGADRRSEEEREKSLAGRIVEGLKQPSVTGVERARADRGESSPGRSLSTSRANASARLASREGVNTGATVICAKCTDDATARSRKGEEAATGPATVKDSAGERQDPSVESMRRATSSVLDQTAALKARNEEQGKSQVVLRELGIAQLEQQYRDLEATDNVIPGYIDALSQRIDAERALLTVTREAEGIKSAGEKKKEQEGRSKKLSDDLNGTFKDGITGLMQGQEGAIDKMAESLKKKVSGALADALYDATLKPAVEKFTGWLSNSITGLFNGGGSGGGSGGGGGGGGNWFGSLVTSVLGFFGVGSAKGNVFSSPGLHAYSSSIVDRPTFFPFAKGIGLMGEAGAEAIMPLRRGTDGRLGVSLQGGGAAAQALHFAPSNVFYIDSRSDRGAVMADLDRVLQANNEGQMEQLKRMRVVPQ
ncbi:phage tail length tape measure family protein [Variovorax sp.]|jgi:phage-related minor tail protein|uniref:phage tail length tape measure family protein n=1 Tax=Variovorax sp. TaxID=1871043 RepID=UPI0037DA584B